MTIKGQFPLNYFKQIMSPAKVLSNTTLLNWGKIIVILIFLNSLLTIPTSLYLFNLESYPFDSLYSSSYEAFSEIEVTDVNETFEVFVEDTDSYVVTETANEGNVQWIIENSTGAELSGQDDFTIVIGEDSMSMTEDNLPVLQISNIQPQLLFDNSDTITDQVNVIIFNEYKPIIMTLIIFMVSIVTLSLLLFIIIGSVIIILKPLRAVLKISTLKSSVNLVVNCLGLPIILSSLVGLLFYDITVMFALLTGGYSLMFLLTYYQAFTKSFEKKKENRESIK